jgi:hypothetical protein
MRLGRHIEKLAVPYKPLLLWLLYIGVIAGHPLCEERVEMVSRLVDELRTAEGAIVPWEAIKEQLKRIAWIDAIFDGIGRKVWIELDAVALV